jgi:uncharacterized cupredoxin-like copper-binding protein
MKRWIVLIVAVIALTGVATFLTQSGTNSEPAPMGVAVDMSKGPQPKVEIAGPTVFDFGMMSQLRKNSHVWEVKNAGEKDLEMWLEDSTCSCTIGKLAIPVDAEKKDKPRVRVKPNETTPIALDGDTKVFANEYSQGVTIGTNDPRRPTFMLTIKGMVYPPVQIFPPEMITLNGISNETVSKAYIAVYSMDMPNMKVTKLTTGRPELITATQSPLTKSDLQQLKVPAGGYRIDIEIKPGLPLGRFSDTLIIETDHPLQKETKVSIRGYATGPISVVPDKLTWRGVNGVVGATHSMTLLVRGDKVVNFEVVQKPGKYAELTVEKTDQKGRHRLTITVPPGTPSVRMDKEIILKTDDPRAAEIKIPADIIVTNSTSG